VKFTEMAERLHQQKLSLPTVNWLIDWLIIVLRPAQEFFTYRWRASNFRSVLGTQSHWARRDLYRATPAVTQDLGFSGLIRRTAPISRLLRHTRGCGGSTLTRVITGPHSVASDDTHGDAEDLFLPGSSRVTNSKSEVSNIVFRPVVI
jgi:hypothetical protein